MLEDRTKKLLKKAGWYEGRKIDITKQVEYLEKAGYEVFEAARNFMEEFGELTIRAKYIGFQEKESYDEHSTKYDELSFYCEDCDNYDENAGVKTIPICELFKGEFVVCLSDSGNFFKDQGIRAEGSDNFWNGILGEYKCGFLDWEDYKAGKELKRSIYKNKNYIVD